MQALPWHMYLTPDPWMHCATQGKAACPQANTTKRMPRPVMFCPHLSMTHVQLSGVLPCWYMIVYVSISFVMSMMYPVQQSTEWRANNDASFLTLHYQPRLFSFPVKAILFNSCGRCGQASHQAGINFFRLKSEFLLLVKGLLCRTMIPFPLPKHSFFWSVNLVPQKRTNHWPILRWPKVMRTTAKLSIINTWIYQMLQVGEEYCWLWMGKLEFLNEPKGNAADASLSTYR